MLMARMELKGRGAPAGFAIAPKCHRYHNKNNKRDTAYLFTALFFALNYEIRRQPIEGQTCCTVFLFLLIVMGLLNGMDSIDNNAI